VIYTPRPEWGGPEAPIGHPTAGAKRLVVIHHSYRPHRECGVSLDRERADVLGMHLYHGTQGWGGIGYNWLVFQSGNGYEGRGWGRVGAHAAGVNSASAGIVIVINGDRYAPTEAALDKAEEFIADGVRLGHIHPEHRRAPHSEFSPKSCPGVLVKQTRILLHAPARLAKGADAIAPMPTLRLGKGGRLARPEEREAVRELQRRLGMADQHRTGFFGPLTDSAVRKAQAAHSLVVDGIVGIRTWAALAR
jgi:N-acetylmuramoyl-L-alanine amidase